MSMVIVPNYEVSGLSRAQPADVQAVLAYTHSLKPSGRRAVVMSLTRVSKMLGFQSHLQVAWSSMTPDLISAVIGQLSEYVYDPANPEQRYTPATINHCIASIRGVMKQLYLANAISSDHYAKTKLVSNVKGSRLPAGRDLSDAEITQLMRICCVDSNKGVRDRAIIAVFLISGLRLHELAGIDLEAYDPASGSVVVIGKGDKQRVVYLGEACHAVNDWLAIRGLGEGALFCPVNKGDRVIGGRMTSQAIYNMLCRRAEQARLKHFSPHDFRRTCIGNMLSDASIDIATIAKHVGHASVTTTARYDRRPDEQMRAAVGRLRVPGL